MNLNSVFLRYSPALIALSGGVDSSALLAFGKKNGYHVYAATAVTEFLAECDLRHAEDTAEKFGAEWYPLKISLLDELKHNPENRCYVCKLRMMSEMMKLAEKLGCKAVFDGSHADDLKEDRAGAQALRELGVISPFQIAEMGKSDVLRLADELGVDKISPSSCLAARISFNDEITIPKLKKVEEAECIMRGYGIHGVLRVRITDDNAVIEVSGDEIMMAELHKDELKRLGFNEITVKEYGGVSHGRW